MLTSKVAKRYAQGLLDFTQESGNTASIFSEMKDVVKIFNESKELKNFFASPIIDAKKKTKAALEIFAQFSQLSKNLITLVIKQGRESHLQDIAQEFINKVVREEHGMPMRTEEDKFVDTGCDSFGIVMVLLAIEDKYNVYSKEEMKGLVIEELTLGNMLDRIASENS